jgi:hypothetical protein
MSEDITKKQDADSTNPLPFEEFVKQQLALILKQQADLRQEMLERFLQLSRQIRDVDAGVIEVKEDVKDLDYKVMPFIKEQINLKRGLDELRDSLSIRS